MTRRLRTFLLCLLMAALPLQGLAAVLKASCGPAHHKQVVQVVHAGQEAVHAHDVHHGHAVEAVQFHHPDVQDTTPDVVGSSAFCSACAVCSASAFALPAATMPGFAEFAPGLALPASAPLLASVVPDGLERPPKTASL